ncbi:MAG: hypothetical protein HONBIEJF_00613 [Fimbriimonadaceae bacterium]|nr:hypothetical protein [Fimbriimonadaceae bacterium]
MPKLLPLRKRAIGPKPTGLQFGPTMKIQTNILLRDTPPCSPESPHTKWVEQTRLSAAIALQQHPSMPPAIPNG